MRELLALPGGGGSSATSATGPLYNLTGARLNDYIEEHMGDGFTAKDFRTWGGTLIAAIALAEHELAGDRDRGEASRSPR